MVDAILPVCLFCSFFFIKMLIKRSCVTKDTIKLNIIAFHDINIYIELTAQDGGFCIDSLIIESEKLWLGIDSS